MRQPSSQADQLKSTGIARSWTGSVTRTLPDGPTMQAGRAPASRKLKSHAVQRSEQVKGRGGMGIRTPDLLIANETLYQLSYTPNVFDFSELHTILTKQQRCWSIPLPTTPNVTRLNVMKSTEITML